MEDNNTVLNLIQKEYLNAGKDNLKKESKIKNNNNEDNNIDLEENKENDHEISNMLSNIGLILEKKDSNPIINNNNQNINTNVINTNNINNINNKEKIIPISIIEKDNKTLFENMKYQMEHPYENKSKSRIKGNNQDIDNNKKIKKKTGIKTNKFKCVGKLNFDLDGLMIINLENDMDKKIDIMQSASKLLLNNNENDKEKKNNKKYTRILDNVPRRIKYIKEKTINEKKMFDIRKKEMLQGVNFDYLNSFKKLFETYPELNNLVEPNKIKKTEEYKLEDKNNKINDNKNNIIEETNIQRQDGPSDAMKILLEVYGIPQNFLEENNPFLEYAKKNGINNNFAFENLFKDIQSYINGKNSKKRNNIFKNSKKDNKTDKENIDADGDLIIESESDDNSIENNKNKKETKKGSKHCVFDSKKNSQYVYVKNEQNEENDEMGKIIDNINKKAEKGIKIGEKTIFSNYKGLKEHSLNFNNKNNKLENNNEENIIENKYEEKENKIKEEINKKKKIINNSKISTKVFMSAFNYDLNNDNDINSKKRSRSKKKKLTESSIKQQTVSISFPNEKNFENNFLSESNYSKNKKGKLFNSVNEFNINDLEKEKEKQLSNIKETVEKEKSSKIEKSEKNEDNKDEEEEDKKKSKDNKKDFGVIGNIRDLDNFDDLFK